jgi:hypothetical protein
MLRWLGLALVAASLASPLQAGHWNNLNRKLGLGWSDGYHSHNSQCWVQEHHVVAPAEPPRMRQSAPQMPATRSQRGPALPSQRSAHRPAYWSR